MREHAHHLVNCLEAGQLAAIVHLMETMIPLDDVTGCRDEDDDTLSAAEMAGVAEADEWLKHNKPIEHEEVLAGFGLTMDDWARMARETPHS